MTTQQLDRNEMLEAIDALWREIRACDCGCQCLNIETLVNVDRAIAKARKKWPPSS